ncbi:MAG: DUF4340 domain-containing protein [Alphaproteobacteria bacterium]|nr:DUF4340 domain-containing protein [Alphaproteobacteria bacterium]
MKSSHVIALGIVAAVAVGGAVAVSLSGPGSNTPSASERVFPALAGRINDVTSLSVARKDESVTVTRKGDAWVVPAKHDYPAAFDKVRRLLLDLSDLRPLEQKTSSPALFASLELEDLSQADAKSTLVTLKDAGGGEILATYVGKQRFGRGTGGDGTYVRRAGGNETWLAKGRVQPDKGLLNWLDKNLSDVARERVAAITVVHADGAKVEVAREKVSDKNFALKNQVPEGKKVKSEWDINNLASPFERLELEDVRPLSEILVVAGGPYGEITTFDGMIVRADLVEADAQTWVKLSARYQAPAAEPSEEEKKEGKLKSAGEVKEEVEALNAKVAAWAYRLPDWKTDNLRKKLSDLVEEEKKGS